MEHEPIQLSHGCASEEYLGQSLTPYLLAIKNLDQ